MRSGKSEQKRGLKADSARWGKGSHPLACRARRPSDKIYLLFIAFLIAFLGILALPNAWGTAFLTIPLAGMILYRSLLRFWAWRKNSRKARDYLRLMEELASRVTAGIHPLRALEEAPLRLRSELGQGSDLLPALEGLSAKLSAGLDLRRSLQCFEREFAYAGCRSFSRVFPVLADQGGKLDLYLQLQRDALLRALQSEEEAASERGGATSEALIMCLMPFIISFSEQQLPFYQNPSPAGNTAYAACYLLSILALNLCLRCISRGNRLPKSPSLLFFDPHEHRSATLIYPLLKVYPSDILPRLKKAIHMLYTETEKPVDAFLIAKVKCLFAFALTLLSLSICFSKSSFLLIFPLSFFLQEVQVFISVKAERQYETLFWPPFFQITTLLLESGLSLEHALDLSISVQLESCQNTPPGRRGSVLKNRLKKSESAASVRDLEILSRRLASGTPAVNALRETAQHRFHAEIAQFFQQLARYEASGGREELGNLRAQTERLLDLHRLARRKEAGRDALLLILPMALDLLIVMAVSVLPVLFQPLS